MRDASLEIFLSALTWARAAGLLGHGLESEVVFSFTAKGFDPLVGSEAVPDKGWYLRLPATGNSGCRINGKFVDFLESFPGSHMGVIRMQSSPVSIPPFVPLCVIRG